MMTSSYIEDSKMTTKTYDTVGDAIAARNERLQAEQAARGHAARAYTNVRDAHKPAAMLTPDKIAAKYHDRKRVGKTAKDHANGNARRNAERKQARAEWQRDNRATSSNFPV